MDGTTLEDGIFSRQAVHDDRWYWFVYSSSTTIDFVSSIITPEIPPVDHYLGYKVKVHNNHDDDDDRDDDDKYKKYEKYYKLYNDLKEQNSDKYKKYEKYYKYFMKHYYDKYSQHHDRNDDVACTTLAFNDLPPGTIVTDQFASNGIIISAENNKSSHPDAAIIFNSDSPTGEDPDLGTPNEDFGGPGIGEGGETGEPSENSKPLGNLLIIAEDIVDVNPADGLVDDPDDEARGGKIFFEFDTHSTIKSVTLVDIDSNEKGGSVMVTTKSSGKTETIPIKALGDNSIQTILVGVGSVTDFKIKLVSSVQLLRLIIVLVQGH